MSLVGWPVVGAHRRTEKPRTSAWFSLERSNTVTAGQTGKMGPMARNLYRIGPHGEIFPDQCTATELADARSEQRWSEFWERLDLALDGTAYQRSGDPLSEDVRNSLYAVVRVPIGNNVQGAIDAMTAFDTEASAEDLLISRRTV